jgi:hypothetical protein
MFSPCQPITTCEAGRDLRFFFDTSVGLNKLAFTYKLESAYENVSKGLQQAGKVENYFVSQFQNNQIAELSLLYIFPLRETMAPLAPLLAVISFCTTVSADASPETDDRRKQFYFRPKSGYLFLKISNLSFNQPMAAFFVMVHNDEAEPLFKFGEAANDDLSFLAENGGADNLVTRYDNTEGVASAVAHAPGPFPLLPGASTTNYVTVTNEYPLVTIASMGINTNDCFIAINGTMRMYPGQQEIYLDGLDSGSEENNENYNIMPGPACPDIDGDNQADGNGEGFVHVHRGFFVSAKTTWQQIVMTGMILWASLG